MRIKIEKHFEKDITTNKFVLEDTICKEYTFPCGLTVDIDNHSFCQGKYNLQLFAWLQNNGEVCL